MQAAATLAPGAASLRVRSQTPCPAPASPRSPCRQLCGVGKVPLTAPRRVRRAEGPAVKGCSGLTHVWVELGAWVK